MYIRRVKINKRSFEPFCAWTLLAEPLEIQELTELPAVEYPETPPDICCTRRHADRDRLTSQKDE